jgi:hypothetical protein
MKVRRYYDVIFVSSHLEIRQALKDAGLRYLLVFPETCCKDEYIARYRERGSPAAFVERLRENWEQWLDSCRNDDALKLVLNKGGFLTEQVLISAIHPDIVDEIR